MVHDCLLFFVHQEDTLGRHVLVLHLEENIGQRDMRSHDDCLVDVYLSSLVLVFPPSLFSQLGRCDN